MAVRRQRATTQATYAMDKNKKAVISKAKRIHRNDKEFYVINISGWYSSISSFDMDIYYKSENNYEHWKFNNNRWQVDGCCK